MMIFIVPVLFVGWKFFKGTKFHRAKDIDLLKNLAEIEEYQRTFVPTKSGYVHFLLHLRWHTPFSLGLTSHDNICPLNRIIYSI